MTDPVVDDTARHLGDDTTIDDLVDDGAWSTVGSPAEYDTLHGEMLDLISDLIAAGNEQAVEWARRRCGA